LSRSAAPQRQTSAFTPLACVEVQLVMQFLDARSLLRLARCERRLLADSRDEFAWRHARGVPLDVGPLLEALLAGSVCRLPRTHPVPVRLFLDGSSCEYFRGPRPADALEQLLREAPAEFDLREIGGSVSHFICYLAWPIVLQLPVARGLRQLSLCRVDWPWQDIAAAVTWKQIGALPQLTELDLLRWISDLPDERTVAGVFAAAPVLDSLKCGTWLGMPLLSAIERPLRRLHLSGDDDHLHSSRMQRLLCIPSLARLQELSLRSIHMENAMAEKHRTAFQSTWRAVWSGMPLLHTLTIQSVDPVQPFLKTLPAAASLRLLCVVLAAHSVQSDPTATMMESLLATCPLLCVTVFAMRLGSLQRRNEALSEKQSDSHHTALRLQELAKRPHAQRLSVWPFAPRTF